MGKSRDTVSLPMFPAPSPKEGSCSSLPPPLAEQEERTVTIPKEGRGAVRAGGPQELRPGVEGHSPAKPHRRAKETISLTDYSNSARAAVPGGPLMQNRMLMPVPPDTHCCWQVGNRAHFCPRTKRRPQYTPTRL